MAIKPGSKYSETIERLEDKIKKGDSSLTIIEDLGEVARFCTNQTVPANLSCYFCRNTIEEKVRIIVEKDPERKYDANAFYPIDSKCYAKAKGISIVK